MKAAKRLRAKRATIEHRGLNKIIFRHVHISFDQRGYIRHIADYLGRVMSSSAPLKMLLGLLEASNLLGQLQNNVDLLYLRLSIIFIFDVLLAYTSSR